MDRRFELLEHTADVGFRAFGSAPAELFENAARALLSFTDGETEPNETRTLEIGGEDYESLLINWLSELLYLFDSGEFAFRTPVVGEISPRFLRARIEGNPRTRESWRLIVKAVTYHQIEVREVGGHWEATVYLDV
ncbi:MAG: archease [Bryobacteraceae bacterium]